MKLALQIVSWIAVVLGVLAIIGSAGDMYALIGGMMFFTQGLLALLYIDKVDKEK